MLRMLALVAFMSLSFTAEAKWSFGTQEKLESVAPVNLPGPNGAQLELARKVVTKHFLAPYYVKDGGYVLKIRNNDKSYFPMPTGAELDVLQKTGMLPNPLPKWEMPLSDKLFGFLLWEILLGIAAWGLIKRSLGIKSED